MKLLSILSIFLLVGCASQKPLKIKTEEVSQKLNGVDFKAKVFYPDSKLLKPAVIVVHEWWGHNDYARARAQKLAELGYVALSIDMYGENKQATHPKDAGAFAKATMKSPKLVKARFDEAIEYLKSRSDVNQKRIGAIGYCFGGSVVLNMARMGSDLKAVASFHGGLKPIVEKSKAIDTNIAVFNGASDPMVSEEDIKNFKKEMKNKKVNYIFKNYPDAKHAFTNPKATEIGKKYNLPLAYNKEADLDSWNSMKEFFSKNL